MTTVYTLYDSDGVLLYVGITDRRMARMATHALKQPWWQEVATAEFEHLTSRDEADARETVLIAQLQPTDNKLKTTAGYRDRPPGRRCSEENCDGLARRRGLCDGHYMRAYRRGLITHPEKRVTVL